MCFSKSGGDILGRMTFNIHSVVNRCTDGDSVELYFKRTNLSVNNRLKYHHLHNATFRFTFLTSYLNLLANHIFFFRYLVFYLKKYISPFFIIFYGYFYFLTNVGRKVKMHASEEDFKQRG